MRTREMSMSDHGVPKEDEYRLKKYCRSLSEHDREGLFQCAKVSTRGLEHEIFHSIVSNEGYRKMERHGWNIPINENDFYAYKRKTLGRFYRALKKQGKM